MQKYTKQNIVVMFNLAGSRGPELNNIYDRHRFIRKISNWFTFSKVINNIIVVNPIRFPFVGSKFFDNLNNIILYYYLAYFKSKLNSSAPIIISLTPFYYDAIKRIKPKKIIYYVSDDYGLFTNNNRELFNEYESIFMRKCDGVVTVSELLFQNKRFGNPNTIKMYNATNPTRFVRTDLTKPNEMMRFDSPIIGCIGKFDDWYDIEFVDEIALQHPKFHFVFIGPVVRNITSVKANNIYFLGQKEYDDIPRYVNCFDICIIPYKDIERIKTVDMPLKLLDYLAAGKPVVAKNINPIINTDHLYKICNDITQFEQALLNYLIKPDEYKKDRIAFAKENSWENRADFIGEWIDGIC